jgi:uncharacterized damage-inducible protein DinB
MEAFFTDFLSLLEQLHTDFKSALHDLPQQALDWKPGAETNSLAALAVHTAASERYWIGDVIAGEPSHRDRESEFLTRDVTSQVLEDRLDASLAYIRQVLDKLDLKILQVEHVSSRNQRKVTCGYALAHTLEHTAQHTAHAQLTRQLWDQS